MTIMPIFIVLLPLLSFTHLLIDFCDIKFCDFVTFLHDFCFIFFSPKNTKTPVPKSDQYRYVVQESGKSNVTITAPAKQVWYV